MVEGELHGVKTFGLSRSKESGLSTVLGLASHPKEELGPLN